MQAELLSYSGDITVTAATRPVLPGAEARGGYPFDLPARQGFRGGGAAARLRGIVEGARRPLAAQLNAKYPSMWWSGAELGLIAFAANAVMVSPSRWPGETGSCAVSGAVRRKCPGCGHASAC